MKNQKNTRCRFEVIHLSEYLDGELGFFRHKLLARHLRRCEACRDRMSDLRAADALVHLTREPRRTPASTAAGEAMHSEPGPGRLPDRLLRELGLDDREVAVSRGSLPRWKKSLAAAAAILILAGVGWITFLRSTREARDLVTLGMENQERSASLIRKAETMELQIHKLSMELLQEDLDEAGRERLVQELALLSEQVVELKVEARTLLVTHEVPGPAEMSIRENPAEGDR